MFRAEIGNHYWPFKLETFLKKNQGLGDWFANFWIFTLRRVQDALFSYHTYAYVTKCIVQLNTEHPMAYM